MDPTTAVALAELVSYGVQVYQQAEAGQITPEQAKGLLTDASTKLAAAIGMFNAAKAPA